MGEFTTHRDKPSPHKLSQKGVLNVVTITTIGTVLLTISVARLAEYYFFDRKKAGNKGVWEHNEAIPEVAMEEV
jgi:hypothetical protein